MQWHPTRTGSMHIEENTHFHRTNKTWQHENAVGQSKESILCTFHKIRFCWFSLSWPGKFGGVRRNGLFHIGLVDKFEVEMPSNSALRSTQSTHMDFIPWPKLMMSVHTRKTWHKCKWLVTLGWRAVPTWPWTNLKCFLSKICILLCPSLGLSPLGPSPWP